MIALSGKFRLVLGLMISGVGIVSFPAWGQYKLNYGLKAPQADSMLPKSRSTTPVAINKSYPGVATAVLTRTAGNEYLIRGNWQLHAGTTLPTMEKGGSLASLSSTGWQPAQVPGTVLQSLVANGVYPHPYYGLNNLLIPDSLCRQPWLYRTAFELPVRQADRRVFLNFHGINYLAEISLNGHALGGMKGAFERKRFEITDYVKANGINSLMVQLFPPPHPGIPHEESKRAGMGPNGGQLCLDGPTFIATEGWDWIPGIRDRDMGIWQDVALEFTGTTRLGNTHIITELPLPDTTAASLIIETDVTNLVNKKQNVLLKGRIGNITFQRQVTLAPLEQKKVRFNPVEVKQLTITHPRLWWPNGYGEPYLYQLELQLLQQGQISDRQLTPFGIRELSYEMTVDYAANEAARVEFTPTVALRNVKPLFDNIHRRTLDDSVAIGRLLRPADSLLLKRLPDDATQHYLIIKVNGQRIYCRGGNWGMDDAMKQVSRNHLEPYFKLHQAAHFNMIRNWTGESTEETFYQLCDEYGMLVWNDFWLSTQGYNLDVLDDSLFLRNAAAVIEQYRNHPSIAIWCPRNEGYAPPALEEGLNDMVAKLDGTRYYQPSSRSFNLRTSGPWHFFPHPEKYEEIASGFSTELGTPSIPTAASMRKMMDTTDLWPIGDVWYYHDFHDGQKEFVSTMDSLYGKAASLDDFCKKAQLLNYDSHRAMFEAWNSRLWNTTTGLLLWMTHPAWPSTVWQTYSWDYETFGSYFGARKACEPVHIQFDSRKESLMVVNISAKAYEQCIFRIVLYDLTGRIVYRQEEKRNVAASQLTHAFTANFPTDLNGSYLARLTLADKTGKLLSENEYWMNRGGTFNYQSFNTLPPVQLKLTDAVRSGTTYTFRITNPSSVPAIAVKPNVVATGSNEIILPAYFSDGYFNLMPGETKTVTVSVSTAQKLNLQTEGYNSSLRRFATN